MTKTTKKCIKLSFYTSLFLLLFSHATFDQLHDQEQAVLLKLKQHWRNPPPLSHWTSSNSSHCIWPEINCSTDGSSVIGLSLQNMNIFGTVPPFICDLNNLTTLDLSYNYMTSNEFPRPLYNCSNLQYLDLSQNNFAGTVPDDIHRMAQLRLLNLGANSFSGNIPASIGLLTELRSLQLFACQFNGSFPPEIGNLSNLERLELAYMTTIMPARLPSEFTKLKKLKYLWVSGSNLVGGIPEKIGEMAALEHLDLSRNNLGGKIPSGLFMLKNLSIMYLYKNILSGEIPRVVETLNIDVIDLSENYLTGTIPNDFGRLTKLSGLALFINQLSGKIPDSIGCLPGLINFYLFSNNLSGTLPPDLGRYSMLEEFQVSSNRLSGPLPQYLGDNGRLVLVVAFNNDLSGELPQSLGNCNNLIILKVHNNRFSGNVPSGLWTLLNLSILMLSNNSFTGEFPEKLSRNLSRLEISHNRFSGKIPAGVSSWRNLVVLNASNNLLDGTIPQEIAALSNLTTLLLANNKLSGKIPTEVFSLRNLEVLDVSNNLLDGTIPQEIVDLPQLTSLLLANNQLSGKIPTGVFFWKNLEVLNASNNLLNGTIPQEIADLPWLTFLLIANNQLSGKIPIGVSSWRNLVVLDASNNLLNGTISKEITALPHLTTLLLYQNRLSGSLPSNILSWKSLTTLNLCRNAISGQIPEDFGSLPGLTDLDLSENQLSGKIPVQLGRLTGVFINLSSNHLTGRIPTGFDNELYARSFLNNPGLCAYSSSVNIDKCNSKSGKISVRYLVLIICSVIATILLALFFVIRIFMRRKKGLDLTWELTSFHRLNFTGSDIMSGMTENNVIGRGGSGMVYRVAVNPSRDIVAVNPSRDIVAVHPSRDIVAVKRIWNSGMLEQKLEKQFLAEVKTLSSIRHSKIVKLLCFISSEDSKLLVYEYLENGSLDLWLHRKSGASTFSDSAQQVNLDWPKRLQIAVGVAHGLSYMHHDCSQPIVHRDVKSSNILLDSEFNAKIADFGLAKMLIKQRESGTTSAVAGSFGYIAPEYAQTGRVNKKIDVYSFGVVLLELTTGRKAYDGDENTALVQWAWRQIQDSKTIVDVLDEEVRKPCNLDEMCFVFKLGILCTCTNPSKRPSMKEVLKNLLRPNPAPNRGFSGPIEPHSRSGQRPTCQVCDRLGHTALVCYHRFDQTYQADGLNPTADIAAAAQSRDLNWYPNIGATHHIPSDPSNLNIHSEEYDGLG